MKEFIINSNDAGQRLDKFVQKTIRGIPVSLMYKAIRTKKIKVNRKRADLKQILNEGDSVQMFLPPDLFTDKIDVKEYCKIKTNLDISYEDENLLIVEKAPGVLVHSGDGDGKTNGNGMADERNTLIYHIQAYLSQKGEYDCTKENSFSPSLCNRIDRNTGGLVISAKNAKALRDMNKRIFENKISKYYLCAVHGKMEKDNDILTGYLFKDSKKNTVYVSENKEKGSKEIKTEYKVLNYNKDKDLSLISVLLLTGRTHQIRAHFAYIGHPLLGDGKYNNNSDDRKSGYKHQALYAYRLVFGESEDCLSYLNKKQIKAKDKNIYFLKEFL